MASYHFSMNVGEKGKAGAGFHFLYICREGKYKTRKPEYKDLVYKEHQNMPAWAANPHDFWKAADEYERANGRTYREFVIALPNELTREQQIELVKTFINDTLGQNHPYSFAIHVKEAALKKGVQQPHAHIMFSERKLDRIERNKERFFKRANSKKPELGGAKKDRSWQKKEKLEYVRELWAEYQNRALEKYGHDVRVDHRSLEAQKHEAIKKGDWEKAAELDRPPESHLGPKIVRRMAKMISRHMGQAKTPAEREAKREEYYEKIEPNKKARNVYYLREYRRIGAAIRKELQRLPDSPQKFMAQLKDINLRLNSLLSERREVIKKVITPERAEAIARSVYARKNHDNQLTGELVSHGRAKYKFDDKEKDSYFVKLKTNAGEKVIWGVDLERAIIDSQVKTGQKIELEFQGKQPVQVEIPVYKDGKLVGAETKQTYRNQWLVKNYMETLQLILQKPEAMAEIEKIKAAVLKKNQPWREKLEYLEMEINALRGERARLREQISQDKALSGPKMAPEWTRYKPYDNTVQKLERAVDKLNREEAPKGGLRARIQAEDERERTGF